MPYTFFCHDCGEGIAVDEDGCCKMCGADAEIKGLSIPLPTPKDDEFIALRARVEELEGLLEECEGMPCEWCGKHFVSDYDTVSEVDNGPGLFHWICDQCLSESDRNFERHRLSPKRLESTAHKEIKRLRKWINDLQAGCYINCVYCGHRYGPNDEVPASMADVLKEHVEQCPEHPMSALKQEVEKLRESNAMACENPCGSCAGCSCADEVLGQKCSHSHLNAAGMCVDCGIQITDSLGD